MAKSEKENTNSTANTFLKALALSIGLSSSGMAEATSHPTKDIEPQKTEISHTPNKDNQYTTTIKLRNDSIKFMQGTHGYYTGQNGGEIRIIKADMSMDSFGYKSYKPHEELLIIHERQHQIDVEQKGVGASPVSLEEEYHRSIHMEVGARIAELLEVRRQYKEADNTSRQEEVLKKFENDETAKNYVKAIRDKKINPNSVSSNDFTKEMSFIKDEAISYMSDPNDSSYDKTLIKNAIINLSSNQNYTSSNPNNLKNDINKIYQIGGFDFNTVGIQDIKVRKAPVIQIADNLLQNGASKEKVIDFLDNCKDFFTAGENFAKADKFDFSGLSKEQAEEIIKTSYIAQFKKEAIYEELILGDKRDHETDFKIPNKHYNTELSIYLNAKMETLEKNNILSEDGNEEKYQQLLKEAKTLKLDPKSWYNEVKDILNIAKDPTKKQELELALQKIEQTQGKQVSTDDFSSGITTPSKEILDTAYQTHKKEQEENKKFNEEYNKENPPPPERLSDFYEKEVMNLQSSILKDELEQKKKEENTIEELHSTQNLETYAYIGDGLSVQIKSPEFNQAELKKITSPNGETVEVAFLDGKKHGAEIYRNKDGEITNYTIYNHGQKIDSNKNQINLKYETRNGMTHTLVELNGKPFGAETITDANGKTKASFYDENGLKMTGKKITKKHITAPFKTPSTSQSINREELKNELKSQTPTLHKTIPTSVQKMNKRVDERQSSTQNKQHISTKMYEQMMHSR